MSVQAGPVRVYVDLRPFNAWAKAATKGNIAFATAKALTRCAVLARDEVRDDLHTHFKIRSPWVARGIQAVPANKRDFPRQQAVVGVRDQFMELQETGGDKQATQPTPNGPARVAVPTRAIVRTSGGRIPKPLKPRVLLADRKRGARAFKDETQGGSIRLRKPRIAGQTRHLLLLYWLKERTHLKARFEFRKTVASAVGAVWGEYFSEALTDALRPKKV